MRLDNWPQLLTQYIESKRNTPFAWGTADCCQFIAGAIAATTGEDPSVAFGSYEDEAGAQALLDGFGGLEGLITAALGGPMAAAQMGRGDVCIADGCACVCTGQNVVGYGAAGLVFVPRSRASLAWRVG